MSLSKLLTFVGTPTFFFLSFCLILGSSGTFSCTSVSVPGGGRFGSELIQEQAILDFYGTEEERNSALKLLKSACKSLRKDRGLACYNLSVLYNSLGDISSAWEYANAARNGDPKDPLYQELVFSVSLQLQAVDSKSEESEDQLFRQAIESCKSGKKEEANSYLTRLVDSGLLSKEALTKGIFSECGADPSLIAKAKPNSVKPGLEYYKTLEKNHPYRKVWDLSGEFGRNSKETSKNKATQSWKDLRKALSSRDSVSARRFLGGFKEGLEELSKESPQSAHLASNLRKAAFLLLSEDSSYSGFKDLAKELSDTPSQTK